MPPGHRVDQTTCLPLCESTPINDHVNTFDERSIAKVFNNLSVESGTTSATDASVAEVRLHRF
jgi:hypothetical protein